MSGKQCIPLLETSLQAAKAAGIPNNRVYILEMPKQFSGNESLPFKTVGQLIAAGETLPKLEALKWKRGQGKKQTAYLCYSSGTTGLPVSSRSACHYLSTSKHEQRITADIHSRKVL
jgi:acyl-CoA synthetase (AMP-forming)/AMP-acid ligase II